jgi:uncharacterized tellurite resistance protein B-like protein
MLDAFKSFVAELTGGDKKPEEFGEGDYRLAAAALLLHAASIDGEPGAAERDMLHALLKRRFELDDAATGRLIDAATVAEQEAIDLYHFTSLLNRTLDEESRLRLIEMMWQIAYADGRVTEFEDNLIWRAADLLGISSQNRIALRRRVAGTASSS